MNASMNTNTSTSMSTSAMTSANMNASAYSGGSRPASPARSVRGERSPGRANSVGRAHSARGARSARRLAAVLAAPLAAALALSACAGPGDDLARQWEEASDKGYVAGDGSTLSIAPGDRSEPVIFEGTTEFGEWLGSDDTLGSVTVVNFWYAGCAPCRAEAADLVAAHEAFAPLGVKFVGVNTRDRAAQAQQFAEEYGVKYPSIMDNEGDRAAQRAFAGQIPLNAVPTTLVLDAEGRVAHRILGQLASESQLRTLINETLAETGRESTVPNTVSTTSTASVDTASTSTASATASANASATASATAAIVAAVPEPSTEQ